MSELSPPTIGDSPEHTTASLSNQTSIAEKYEKELDELDPKLKKLILDSEDGWVRWIDAKTGYSRLTFLQENYCRVCEKTVRTNEIRYTDNYIGRCGLYGWAYCDECGPFIQFAYDNKEINVEHLFRYTYLWLADIQLNFWRRSRSDPTRTSYMVQDAKIAKDVSDVILYTKNRIGCNVEWPGSMPGSMPVHMSTSTIWKTVPLSNIICFNRALFGYSTDECRMISLCKHRDNPKWIEKWLPKFQYEYQVANAWDIFRLCVNRIFIQMGLSCPIECKYYIKDYLGELSTL
jgi:hypothetical protein